MEDCIKTIRVRRAVNRVKRAKLNAYRKSVGLPYIQHYTIARICKIVFRSVCCFCLRWRVRGTTYTALDYILLNGTLPNKIAKSLTGFLCGIVSVYFFQIMMQRKFNMTPSTALYYSIPMGTVLAFGLAVSQSIRFFCLLMVPQIFTQQVRILILGFALSLAISGPGKNYIYNMEILHNTLQCSMDMLNEAFEMLKQIIRDPLSVIGHFFRILKHDIESTFANLKETFDMIKTVIVEVASVVKKGFRWLKDITEMCNSEFGSPYDRCIIEFKEAVVDCVDRLGVMSFMCHVDALDGLCELAKVVDILCILPNLMKENIVQPIEDELDKMLDLMKEFFDVRIHTTYHLDIDLNSSKTAAQILQGVKAEILQELHWILICFGHINFIIGIFFILVTLFSTVLYRYWYLHQDSYDNIYLTRGIVKMDMEREQLGREIIFPLKFNETRLYGRADSIKIFKAEGKHFNRKLFIVILSSIPTLSYLCMDLGLYLLLLLIQEYGAIVTDLRGSMEWINVTGEGFMADIDRAILKAVQPLHDALPVLDNTKCLPNPIEPNYFQFSLIIFLLLLCFFLVCTETYGLRLRHLICGFYRPERQQYRDRWLYVNILSSRGSFFRYARNQVIAKLTGDDKTFRVSFRDRLIHACPCGRKLFWFLETTKKQCFLCGRSGDMQDYVNFYHCPICKSVYCQNCFHEVAKKCPVCTNTMDFDGLSIDEESGSSSGEDEENVENIRRPLLTQNVNKFKNRNDSSTKFNSTSSMSSSSSTSTDKEETSTQSKNAR